MVEVLIKTETETSRKKLGSLLGDKSEMTLRRKSSLAKSGAFDVDIKTKFSENSIIIKYCEKENARSLKVKEQVTWPRVFDSVSNFLLDNKLHISDINKGAKTFTIQ